MKSNKIVYREGTEADKEKILELFSASFIDSEVSEKQSDDWEWQMIENYDGKAYIGLAEYKNIVVGHYAVIPYTYLDESGKRVRIGLVVDVMVHPKYQRRGIFLGLSNFSLPRAVKKLNLTFTVGYPFSGTTLSSVLPGHLKAGWNLGEKLKFFVLPINFNKNLQMKLPRKLKFISFPLSIPAKIVLTSLKVINGSLFRKKFDKNLYKINIEKCVFFTQSDLNLLINQSKGKFIKQRSAEFLRWRFIKKPNVKYYISRILNTNNEQLSLSLLRIFNLNQLRMGVIVDFVTNNNNLDEISLDCCINFLKQQNCDSIAIIDYKKQPMIKNKSKFGFIDTGEFYQIIHWKKEKEKYLFPKFPRINFVDFDIF